MDKSFQPEALETNSYERWEKSGYFAPPGKGEPYCIMIPPPNVTGSLHMGHAFQQTLMDILIRYHRMKGRNTLWLVGTDHAGIATQMVVERQLAEAGLDRRTIGREEFVKRIWQWKEESGGTITRQLRRLGASVDWSRERFTLDPALSNAVQETFIRLYNEGLIYRGKRLVNWDPVLLTALSDLEVESKEEPGELYHLRYPLADGSGSVVVATTRPETMLGDVAVAVNPEDERYQHLVGKEVLLPLANRKIPIIADNFVERDFGTGCVKITPAHDFNDFAVAERHHLDKINIFTIEAKLNENVPLEYQGLDRFVARKKVLEALKHLNLIEKIEKYTIKLSRGDRSGAILEPRITDQWFIKMESLAKPAIEAVTNGKIRFTPQNWEKTYFEWMNNIQDWCISRQLWWGHRIPAWYDENGKIYVGESEAAIRAHHKLAPDMILTQDEDVLDTWFSSALWPFSTLGWPEKTSDLETFYPTNTLITGFDIIFFWVARMVMFGLKFTGEIPFKDVYINGLIQDQDGIKMSKTKGNVIDPLDVVDGIDIESLVKKRTSSLMQPQLAQKIEKATRAQFPNGIQAYGMDALRFTFSALATPARYIRFDLARVEGYRHFCNKLWNAARFVLMNVENKEVVSKGPHSLSLPDRWIVSKLQAVKQEVEAALNTYRFDLAAQALYDFIWHEFCDWYLELSKPALQGGEEAHATGTRFVLVSTLEEILRLVHPFMPFITEAIWERLKPILKLSGDTIMLQAYPEYDASKVDLKIEAEVNWLKAMIEGIRNIRGSMNISPAKSITVLLCKGSSEDKARIAEFKTLLCVLAKIGSLDFLPNGAPKPPAATALVGDLEILIPLAGLIDKEAEMSRLQRELDKRKKDLERVQVKLHNPHFVSNAPPDVVLQEKKLAGELEKAISQLNTRMHEMESI